MATHHTSTCTPHHLATYTTDSTKQHTPTTGEPPQNQDKHTCLPSVKLYMELEPSAKPTTPSLHNLTSYAYDYHQTGHLTDHHHTDHFTAEYTTETAAATPQCRVDAHGYGQSGDALVSMGIYTHSLASQTLKREKHDRAFSYRSR